MKVYCYKVRRQAKFLDDSSALKRATSTTSTEQLVIGDLYLMHVGNTRGFYRVEALKWEMDCV